MGEHRCPRLRGGRYRNVYLLVMVAYQVGLAMKYLLIVWMSGSTVPGVPWAEFDDYDHCAMVAQSLNDSALRNATEKDKTFAHWVCIEKK
jgi:hypothetical protein